MIEARLCIDLGPEVRVVSAEAGICDVIGYSPEDLASGLVRLGRLVHPDDHDIASQIFSQEVSPAPAVVNLRMRHADGRIRCIRAEFSRHMSRKGRVELRLCLQDVRSLPRTMPDAASVPTLRAMLENTNDFIYFKDRNHVFTGASQTLVSLCEPVAHWTDFIGKTDYDVFPEAYADIYYCLEKAVFTGSEVAQDVQQTLTRDGQRGWVDNRKYPIRDDSGTIVGLYGMARDITELKQAQANLETYSDHLEDLVQQRTTELGAIFDAAPIGIVLLCNRVVLKCNRMLEILLGYDKDELIGHSTRTWYQDDTEFELIGRQLYPRIEGGETVHLEHELIRKDGTRLWARVSIRLLEPGIPESAALATMADVTSERAAIEEMARARAIAEDAANTKTAFLANMSHEIRTPLNAVIGMTHLALKADPPPAVRDYLHKIHGSSQHLLSVINDILDYSKLEAGKTALEQDAFELDRLFDEIIAVFGERIGRKGLEFVIDIRPEVPRQLIGDVFRIRQVLINLINNAIKFTEKGYVSIVVSAPERAEGHALICFAISDSGIGISEEHHQNLFQSFHQADASTTRKFGGTGLGLAISLGLAHLMAGGITIRSTPGVGSTFAFTARLAIGDSSQPAYLDHPDLRGLRMLIVDDNAQAREVIKEMSRRMGFDAHSVASGEDALEEAERAEHDGQPYDLIVLDWKMPAMDGIQVAHCLPERLGHEAPRTVMMTAFDRNEVVPAAAGEGVREVLTKPVTPSTLFHAVIRQLGTPQNAPPPSPPRMEALAPHAEFKGARVLVAEDNELGQEVAKGLLTCMGLDVDIAENGAIAVAMAQKTPYELVFMDMQMPIMDGLAATREIRRSAPLKDLPIIAMTANAMATDRQRCLEAGMNDHVGKPIDPQKLTATLQKWLKRTPQPPRLAPAPGTHGAVACPPRTESPLDHQRGLAQVAGIEKLYHQILAQFVAGQHDSAERICSAVQGNDWKTAEQVAHNLKGTSAQIGAIPLRRMAERLQSLTHDQQAGNELDTLLHSAMQELPEVIAAAKAILEQT